MRNVLKNRNCFITGATGGIGRQIALKMAAAKCNLFLTATRMERIKLLQKEIKAVHSNTIEVCCQAGDLNSVSDIDRLIASCQKQLKSIDIFIHSAGTFIVKPLSETDLNDFEQSFNLHVKAPFLFIKAFSQGMIKNRWGRIILIGSSSAYTGVKNTSLYCASKHALLGLSRSFHDELKVHNIRTFCVSPAGTKTEMGRKIENQDYNTFLDPEEIAEFIVFASSFDEAMICDEVRLNRMIIQ